MESRELLLNAFDNVEEAVRGAVEGIDPELLTARVRPGANTVAWLVWHLTRVQDDHIAHAFGLDQVWLTQDWEKRFGLDLPRHDTGYGHSSTKVAKVRVDSGDLLTGYYDAVHEQTLRFVTGLSDADLDEVIDASWSPPVTLGVRLVSVVADDLQHAGQAALLNGFLRRSR